MGRSREQEKIRELVSAYIDGELPPDDVHYVGRLIQEDPRYAQVYASYRGIRMDLRALPRPEVPPAVSQAVRARAAMMQPGRPVLNIRQRVARITAAAATLAATFAAIFTGGFGLQQHFAHVAPGVGPNSPISISVPAGSATTATVLNTNIRFDEPAQIRFTRPMNEQTVKTSVLFTPAIGPGNLLYDNSTFTLSTKPKTLTPNTQYRVDIPAGLKDAEGNDVSATSFTFFVRSTTPDLTTAPTVVAATAAINPTPVQVAVVATGTAAPAPAPDATETPLPTGEGPAPTEPAVAPTEAPAPVVTAKPIPRPTNTPVPAPTTPPPASTATAAPTVAPTATSAPTVAPTPTTPAIAVADKFKGAYASTANRLGAATGGAQSVSTSQLFFQNGFMIYASGQPIYVFYTGDRTWAAYGNPGNSGAGSDGGPGPSGNLFKPPRAFGVVWTAQGLQGRLGYATSAGETTGSGTIQTFEGGTILSSGSDVYVILKNGSWQNFSG